VAAAVVASLLVLAVAFGVGSALGRGSSRFGGDGRVVTRFEVHPQMSGKIEDLASGPGGVVAVATEGRYAQPIQLALLNADGSPDRSFGSRGLVRPQLESGPPLLDDPVRIALTGRGGSLALLVAGSVETAKGQTAVQVRKYGADGRLDRSFGQGGVVAAPGVAVAALFATPGGGFILFADRYPGRGASFYGGIVSRFGRSGNRLAGGTPKKRLPAFESVYAEPGGGFLAEVGERETALVRFDPAGEVTGEAPTPTAGHSRFTLVGVDGEGRALGWMDESLVRLRPGDRTVDAHFHAALPPCGYEGHSTRPEGALTEVGGAILFVNDCGLVRIGADGAADPSFAGGGYSPAAAGAARLAAGPEGSIVYARFRGKQSLPVVGRVDSGGAPDGRFGSAGSVSLLLPAPRASTATALVADRGHLVAAGHSLCGGECETFALARYRARDGRLDHGFGKAGTALGATGLGGASGVAVAPDGDIVAVGSTPEGGLPPDKAKAFELEKFDPSGRLVHGFGKEGVVVDQIDPRVGRSEAEAVAIGPDGKILVAGLAGCRSAGLCLTVARYLPGGAPDRSFARRGVFQLDGGTEATGVAIQPDGRIVATGGEEGYFVTVRLMPDGRLDPSFGEGGVVVHRQRVEFKELADFSIGPQALALGPDGSVTVAGGTELSHAIFERYLPDGRRDPRFGHRGRLLVQHLGVAAIATTRCGIVAAGTMKVPGHESQMAVAGIGRDGRVHFPPHPLFGIDRRSSGAALVLTPGEAIVAGSRRSYSLNSEFALAATPLSTLLPRC
jgi:uncharacterized delta-60 repeat protein